MVIEICAICTKIVFGHKDRTLSKLHKKRAGGAARHFMSACATPPCFVVKKPHLNWWGFIYNQGY